MKFTYSLEVLFVSLIGCNGLYTGLLTPSSLYAPDDYTITLTHENFEQQVYNSSSAWNVQFYNSWCGHCIRFSPTWKKLAGDIHNWRNIIKLGVINCANPDEAPKCDEYKIKTFPTMRFFFPNMQNFTIPPEFRPSTRESVVKLREAILLQLESANITSPPPHWPHLRPVKRHEMANSTKPTILVTEDETSFVGRQLIMDFNEVRSFSVRRALKTEYSALISELYRIEEISPTGRVNYVEAINSSRTEMYNQLRDYMSNQGYDVPLLDARDVIVDGSTTVGQTAKQQKLVHMLFREDLEAALNFTFASEVARKPTIEGESLIALINYLNVLDKYFPFENAEEAFTRNLSHELSKYTMINGAEYVALLEKHASEFLRKPKSWVGCKGSISARRGYTCGMWMTFHTLTVRRYVAENTTISPNPEVLNAITEYIRNFFGCTECAKHFLKMSETIRGNISDSSDEVIWLWRAHNNVNLRLAGDYTEDPAFPKVVYPHPKHCSGCYFINGTWNKVNIVKNLIDIYTNVRRASDAEALRLTSDLRTLSSTNVAAMFFMLTVCLMIWFAIKIVSKRRRPQLDVENMFAGS